MLVQRNMSRIEIREKISNLNNIPQFLIKFREILHFSFNKDMMKAFEFGFYEIMGLITG